MSEIFKVGLDLAKNRCWQTNANSSQFPKSTGVNLTPQSK